MRAAGGHCMGRGSGTNVQCVRACGLAACVHCWKRAERSPLRASSSGVFARTARMPGGGTCRGSVADLVGEKAASLGRGCMSACHL